MRRQLLFVSVSLLCLSAPLRSQEADDARVAKGFAALDADGNGTVSLAEWTAQGRKERGFQFMDADHDGALNRAELVSGLKRLREMRGQ